MKDGSLEAGQVSLAHRELGHFWAESLPWILVLLLVLSRSGTGKSCKIFQNCQIHPSLSGHLKHRLGVRTVQGGEKRRGGNQQCSQKQEEGLGSPNWTWGHRSWVNQCTDYSGFFSASIQTSGFVPFSLKISNMSDTIFIRQSFS